jgi:biotin carboxyl carrier protein
VGRVTNLGDGVYRVEVDGRLETVYVAGPTHDRWAFWNGQVYRFNLDEERSPARRIDRAGSRHTVTAPMPAKVVAVPVAQGQSIKKNDVVVVIEAMKMELPIRAMSDSTVVQVHCREGQLVDADAVLLELE